MILQVVFHKTFADCSGIVPWFQKNATRYLMCEHEADEEILTTHCHAAIDITVSKVALEKEIKKLALGGKGQLAIMSKTQKKIDGERREYNYDKLCIYILKGSPVTKATNHTDAEIDKWVKAWVAYTPPCEITEKDKAQTQWDIIQLTIEQSKVNLWWENVVSPEGHMLQVIKTERREHIFRLLNQNLNAAKIRTSRNELERIYVTLLRQDDRSLGEIYYSISKNIFRT